MKSIIKEDCLLVGFAFLKACFTILLFLGYKGLENARVMVEPPLQDSALFYALAFTVFISGLLLKYGQSEEKKIKEVSDGTRIG